MLRTARQEDTDRCFEIETSAFAADEAASRATIAKRIRVYPQGFLVLESGGEILGFVNSGCAHVVEMADEAFKDLVGHDPGNGKETHAQVPCCT